MKNNTSFLSIWLSFSMLAAGLLLLTAAVQWFDSARSQLLRAPSYGALTKISFNPAGSAWVDFHEAAVVHHSSGGKLKKSLSIMPAEYAVFVRLDGMTGQQPALQGKASGNDAVFNGSSMDQPAANSNEIAHTFHILQAVAMQSHQPLANDWILDVFGRVTQQPQSQHVLFDDGYLPVFVAEKP